MELERWVRGQHRGVLRAFDLQVKGSVPEEAMTKRPGDVGNSIAWLMWHVARTEDAVVNTIVRGNEQILTAQGWSERLGWVDTRIGTGYGDDEVSSFAERVNVDVLEEYWRAVSDSTSQWMKTLAPEDYDQTPDLSDRTSAAPDMMAAGNDVLVSVFGGSTVAQLLAGPVIGHGYMHVGEMSAVRGRLGFQAWI